MAKHPSTIEAVREEIEMRSAWRPWHGSRRRAPNTDLNAPAEVDGHSIAELLDNVHRLRLTLAADLATAASAIEADEPAIARDIIEADSAEVLQLAGTMPTEPQPQPAGRRRRALLALPAIPLAGALAMTGAAALTAGRGPAAPATSHAVSAPAARQTPHQISETATTTLQQLERAMSRNPQPFRVVALAAHLHDQLTALIASSVNNPARLGEVQHLLSVEQKLLEHQTGEAAAIALAASRKVTHLLRISGLATARPTTARPTTAPPTTAPPTIVAATNPPAKNPTKTPTPTKSSPPPKAQPSTPPPEPALPTARPTSSRTAHHHHHHHHLSDPLLEKGLIDRGQ
jgi:hypothetical protein